MPIPPQAVAFYGMLYDRLYGIKLLTAKTRCLIADHGIHAVCCSKGTHFQARLPCRFAAVLFDQFAFMVVDHLQCSMSCFRFVWNTTMQTCCILVSCWQVDIFPMDPHGTFGQLAGHWKMHLPRPWLTVSGALHRCGRTHSWPTNHTIHGFLVGKHGASWKPQIDIDTNRWSMFLRHFSLNLLQLCGVTGNGEDVLCQQTPQWMQQCPQFGFVVKLGQETIGQGAKHVPSPNAITLSSIGVVVGYSVQIAWWSNRFPWSNQWSRVMQPAMTIHDPNLFTRNELRSFKRGVQRRAISKWPAVEVQQTRSGLQSLRKNTWCLQATCIFLQSTFLLK